ncbi:hypothetical protein TNCV_3147221 [Trichonephila clavipes]|nr:hypothetical protein TNCV_3147221 [Trichonephila clavipes]
MARKRAENRERSLGYPGFMKPVFTKDSKAPWEKEKITWAPRDCDTRTHLKKGCLFDPPTYRPAATKSHAAACLSPRFKDFYTELTISIVYGKRLGINRSSTNYITFILPLLIGQHYQCEDMMSA